jgi:hypothetical protein
MPDSLVKQEEVKFGWFPVISADHILNFLKFSRVDGAVVGFQVFQVLGLTTDGDTMMRFYEGRLRVRSPGSMSSFVKFSGLGC